MSDIDVPAGAAGGPTPVPAELPERLRVHALAKMITMTSRQVLDALESLGVSAKGVQSSIDRATALRVIEALGAEPAITEPGSAGEPASAGEPGAGRQEASGPAAEPEPEAPGGRHAGPTALPMFAAPSPMFLPPSPAARPPRGERPHASADDIDQEERDERAAGVGESAEDSEDGAETKRRRRRGRRGRGRGKGGDDESAEVAEDADTEARDQDEPDAERDAAEGEAADDEDSDTDGEEAADGATPGSRRRRRRRRRREGADGESDADDPPNTITRVREARAASSGRADGADDGIQGVRGSTRLEAKRQRRRDGRDAGRRRAPVLTEAEFLARRESVERTMVVRQHGERSEIGVLEDGVLVEHFVTSSGGSSLVGNVYLGRVQNVLPSMEAAFVDIGRGRNAVLYAGEVDWDAAGLAGKARRIEQALSSGDSILVQVTKDPVGHKGARLTTQISLPGRFLVYVPSGGTHGISRKLADTERRRLKDLLKEIVPEDAGVIIRTASEGVSQEALERDVRRLQAQWEVVKGKAEAAKNTGRPKAPELLYEEPDLMIKVVRDQFNEDFSKLVVSGDDAWDTLQAYLSHVAPELMDRLHRHVGATDVFTEYRIDEQLTKALDRKVWLPSGGTLVIDRTEAMTVIDVNTGKFTGSGGNLEETVTRNNLEAAEEIVRQLRLRDIGGIIVVDFIDMVLESNRDLVLRRLTECLGRDRTRHQVAEVTSLGLVQMTRKRVGVGLLEAFSMPCEHCRGRGVMVSTEPVEPKVEQHQHGGSGGGRRRGRPGGATAEHGNGLSGGRQGRTPAPVPAPLPAPADGVGPVVPADAELAGQEPPKHPEPDAPANGRPLSAPPEPRPAGQEPAVRAEPGQSADGSAPSAEPAVPQKSSTELAEVTPARPDTETAASTGEAPRGPDTETEDASGESGQAGEPVAMGAPDEPVAVGAPDEPVAVGAPDEPVAVGVPDEPGRPARRRRRVASRPAGPPETAHQWHR
jgi:ribonuclease E